MLSDVDPATFDLMRNSLGAITDEMALTIVRTSRSVVAKHALDFSAALCDAEGRTVAQGLGLLLHLGSVHEALADILSRPGMSLGHGDVVLTNDPYSGGNHLLDLFLFKPIFVGRELVAIAALVAHYLDVGGGVPGGHSSRSAEIFEEGIRIPPVKFVEAGKVNRPLLDTLLANTRMPTEVRGDLEGNIASLHVAESHMQALCSRYGTAAVKSFMASYLDYGRRVAQTAIREIPDGDYHFTDWLDDDEVSDEPVRIEAAVAVTGPSITIDFSGSSPQRRSGINGTKSAVSSAAFFAIKSVLGPDVPDNAGYYEAIRIVNPEGTVCNPRFPAAVAGRGLTACRAADAVRGALAQALPERAVAGNEGGTSVFTLGGIDPAGEQFLFVDSFCGSGGASATGDGPDGAANPFVNIRNIPVEVTEAEYPVIVESFGLVPDTGGPGRQRGALALGKRYRFLRGGTMYLRSDRRRFRPWGLFGGQAGAPTRMVLDPDGARVELPAKTTRDAHEGDVIFHVQAGGGGYGDPLDRPPALVEADVNGDKVSPNSAFDDYGAVLAAGPGGRHTIDLEATEVERSRRRATAAGAARPSDTPGQGRKR